jgi:anti-sigma factor RsiW
MHDHDLDLIAAYAEGDLPPAEAAHAARLVERCEECRLEFATQQQVRRLLTRVSPVTLDPDERRVLRTRVHEAIRPRRSLRWAAVVPAAAVAVFALVGLGSLLSKSQGGEAEDTAAAVAEVAPAAEESFRTAGAEHTVETVDLGEVTADELVEALQAGSSALLAQSSPTAAEVPCSQHLEGAVLVVFATVDGEPLVVFVDRPGPDPGFRAYTVEGCRPTRVSSAPG